MSDDTWADLILAESSLPDDDFTFTDGSNYGLDGFYFDLTMNEGVLDGVRLPETKGLAHLPDGFVPDVPEKTAADEVSLEDLEDGIDLSTFIEETDIEDVSTLTDHDWLDPTQEQNPDRLPVSPADRGLGELWDAWGVNRRTDGIHLHPDNKDLEIAEYEETLKETPQSGLPGNQRREEIKETIRWAMVQSAAGPSSGLSFDEIKQAVADRLGHDAKLARMAMQRIEDEHGLAGNVFVYSGAYPLIHKARFGKRLKKYLRGMQARYVVVPEGEQRLAVWEAIGKKPVTEVPWKAALKFYSPKLKAAGYKLASKGSPKSRLKRAFLHGVKNASPEPSAKPVDVRPADRVTTPDARKAFRVAEAPPRQLIDQASRDTETKRRNVLVQIAKWTKAGHLTRKEAHRLARSTVDPTMILRTAAMLVKAASGPKSRTYDGTGETQYKQRRASVSKQAAWRQLEVAESEQTEQGRQLEAGRREELGVKLGAMVGKGLLTKKEAARLTEMDKPVHEILKLAAAAAQSPHLRPAEMSKTETKEYGGALVSQAPQQSREARDFDPEEKHILAAAKASDIKAKEFRSLLKWARIKMTEGSAGDELDQLFRFRFSKPLLKAAKKLLKAVRKEHEGLAGHLYIDAGAYIYGVGKRGTKGCDQGALQHRGNQLKVVLEMARCSSCVSQSTDGVCLKYNKPLVASVPVDDPAEYQKQAIKMANASDAEVTASLFAPAYDQGEYALVDPLADISIDEAVDTEELGEILFGGMEL